MSNSHSRYTAWTVMLLKKFKKKLSNLNTISVIIYQLLCQLFINQSMNPAHATVISIYYLIYTFERPCYKTVIIYFKYIFIIAYLRVYFRNFNEWRGDKIFFIKYQFVHHHDFKDMGRQGGGVSSSMIYIVIFTSKNFNCTYMYVLYAYKNMNTYS